MVFPKIKLNQMLLIFERCVQNDPKTVWFDTEPFNLGKPLTLASLSFILNQKVSEGGGDNMIVGSTIKARDMIKKWEKTTDV